MSKTGQDGEDGGDGVAIDLQFVGTDQLVAELMGRCGTALIAFEPLVAPESYVIRCAGSMLAITGLGELLKTHLARGVAKIVKQS